MYTEFIICGEILTLIAYFMMSPLGAKQPEIFIKFFSVVNYSASKEHVKFLHWTSTFEFCIMKTLALASNTIMLDTFE